VSIYFYIQAKNFPQSLPSFSWVHHRLTQHGCHQRPAQVSSPAFVRGNDSKAWFPALLQRELLGSSSLHMFSRRLEPAFASSWQTCHSALLHLSGSIMPWLASPLRVSRWSRLWLRISDNRACWLFGLSLSGASWSQASPRGDRGGKPLFSIFDSTNQGISVPGKRGKEMDVFAPEESSVNN